VAPPTTRTTRTATNVSKNLFKDNTANVAAPKTYTTQQQPMIRTRNSKKKKVTATICYELIGNSIVLILS
jgi:hypothetical protein